MEKVYLIFWGWFVKDFVCGYPWGIGPARRKEAEDNSVSFRRKVRLFREVKRAALIMIHCDEYQSAFLRKKVGIS